MAQVIQSRNGTASQWTLANPILAAGEIGVETDTGKVKVGDGVTNWNQKAYIAGVGSTTSTQVSFNTAIQLDGFREVAAPFQVTGPLTFTLNSTGLVSSGSWNVTLIADGANVPNFGPFLARGGQAYSNAAGQENEITFWFSGGKTKYAVLLGDVIVQVPGTVGALASTANTDTSIALSWSAPTTGGSVSDYVIEYKLAAASTWTAFAHTASTATSATITGLTTTNPGVAYNVRVSGKNSGGTGTPSSTISVTLASTVSVPSAPTTPVATAGAAQISFAFGTPSSNGGASIDSYRVTLSTGETKTGTTSPIVVTGLSQVARTGTVAAHNSVGWGPESAGSNIVTPAAASSSVTDNFDRADSNTSSGPLWTALEGTIWGITSNKAVIVNNNGVGNPKQSTPFTNKDNRVSVDVTLPMGGEVYEQGVFSRYVSSNTYVWASATNGKVRMWGVTGGYGMPFLEVTRANTPGETINIGLDCKGNVFTLYINGVAQPAYTLTDQGFIDTVGSGCTSTTVGILGSNGGQPRNSFHDNFVAVGN